MREFQTLGPIERTPSIPGSDKKSAKGLSLLEDEGKVFDCLVRPPTLKHVETIGDDDGDDDNNVGGDDDDDDGDHHCVVRPPTLKHVATIGGNIGGV